VTARVPLLALTMGDPAGIGPEIVVRALTDPTAAGFCRALVVGDARIMERHRALFAPGLSFRVVDRPGFDLTASGAVGLVDTGAVPEGGAPWGMPTADGGAAAVACIERASALALAGEVDAIVTAPIAKAAIRLAGSPFPGHTEMLAALTGTRDYAMMLAGGGLRVSLATIHLPLARVPAELDRGRIVSVIRLTAGAVARLGYRAPRIAVCGLNPHAGEDGMFGSEDKDIIAPAVADARSEGIDAVGPLPADTVFHRALRGDFAAVVAMYHDQGLGPLKTIAFDEGVNVTLGLPIIRTSPDHGTAYDIAGKGSASPQSFLAAMRMAAGLASGRV
jgi:4-hydroxythreonine-4-phosphate dehydrogenase